MSKHVLSFGVILIDAAFLRKKGPMLWGFQQLGFFERFALAHLFPYQNWLMLEYIWNKKKHIFNNNFIWNACIENTFIFICLFDLLKISIRYKMRKKSQYSTFTGFHRLHSWRFWFVHQGFSSIHKLTIKVIFISNVELFLFKNLMYIVSICFFIYTWIQWNNIFTLE